MHQTNSLWEKIFLFLKIATPITITQFSLIASTFVAVFLTGQYSTIDLAGVSIGYNIWVPCFFGILGILLGISPIIAQLLGANKIDDMRNIIHQGLYLATLFSVFLIIVGCLFFEPCLSLLHLDPDAMDVSISYMKVIAFAVFPLMWVCILRNTVDSHGYTHYSMYIMLTSFVIGTLANYGFILGHFGLPALGGIGAGIATAVSVWFNVFAYIGVLCFCKPFRKYRLWTGWERPQWIYIREQLALGIPIGISIFCEVSIFSVAGLLMARYGTEIIAAHQAAISFTNLFYGFPLSISVASTIMVAYEVGRKDLLSARTYSYIARITAVIIAALIMCFSFTHMENIARLYTVDDRMVYLIMSFLQYALFFTLFDAFGTPIQGILRGYRDVRIISVIAIGSYWGTCIPTALICMKYFHMGPYGIWVGLLTSVGIASVLFMSRVWYIQHNKFNPHPVKVTE